MSVELWLAYAVACAALLAIPGPTVMLVVGYALGHGRRAGWATIPGVTLGHLTAMTASLAAAGVALTAPAAVITLLKLAVGGYLVWQGIRSLRRARPATGRAIAVTGRDGTGAMFRNAYVVTALNPKCVVFFTAFLPQFVAVEQPRLPQFAIMTATFLALAAANTAAWALLAGEARARFLGPTTLPLANGIGGGILVAAGLLTMAARIP